MKILVVEDEEFSKQMLEEYIVQLGHDVATASNGSEAWELLNDGEFRLVITDWMMPGIDGLELVRRIRSRSEGPYVYTILLTSKTDSKDVVRGIMDGADDYLTKPYDFAELDARVRSGRRVIELEESLSARNIELKSAKTKLEATNNVLSRVNKRMKRDLDAAARIQRSLLPAAPPKNAAIDCAWIFRPCDELAGDIFNIFKLDQSTVGFYLLDVAGHGVQAALLSVTLSRVLSPSAGPSSILFSQHPSGDLLRSPSEVAMELNRRFPIQEEHDQFFTLLYGSLNISSGELRYVSAGHPHPVLVTRENAPRLLAAGGFPVGIADDPDYRDETVVLNSGDRIFLYSDGVLEAENSEGNYFGSGGLLECVGAPEVSLNDTVNSIEEKVLDWCNGQPQDDISVLAMSMFDREG